ncbi:MAG: dTDP-4-dehydrorhamnose 3,5-epimerase [Magnetospiraceae bacterium]
MDVTSLEIPEIKVIVPRRFGDSRGYFCETFNKRAFAEATGFDLEFVQDNHSLSAEVGTLRGLHFQAPPHAQDKLVRVVRGKVFDVAVDIRKGSPTYGKWVGATLSAEKGEQILIPKGFAHAFVTLEPKTEVVYKVTDFYAPETDGGIIWDDPEIAVTWPVEGAPKLSDKDARLPRLADLPDIFTYEG